MSVPLSRLGGVLSGTSFVYLGTRTPNLTQRSCRGQGQIWSKSTKCWGKQDKQAVSFLSEDYEDLFLEQKVLWSPVSEANATEGDGRKLGIGVCDWSWHPFPFAATWLNPAILQTLRLATSVLQIVSDLADCGAIIKVPSFPVSHNGCDVLWCYVKSTSAERFVLIFDDLRLLLYVTHIQTMREFWDLLREPVRRTEFGDWDPEDLEEKKPPRWAESRDSRGTSYDIRMTWQ